MVRARQGVARRARSRADGDLLLESKRGGDASRPELPAASPLDVIHHGTNASHEAHPRGPSASSRVRRGYVKTDLVSPNGRVGAKYSNDFRGYSSGADLEARANSRQRSRSSCAAFRWKGKIASRVDPHAEHAQRVVAERPPLADGAQGAARARWAHPPPGPTEDASRPFEKDRFGRSLHTESRDGYSRPARASRTCVRARSDGATFDPEPPATSEAPSRRAPREPR